MIINQWVPAAHRGDAIGDSARRVRAFLRELGHQSDLFALSIDDDLRGDVRSFNEAAAHSGDITILHFALISPMTAAFAALRSGRVLQYHNITPAQFFAPYDPQIFRLAALGREDLATLVGATDLALGDSEFNRCELEAMGFTDTGVFPIAVDLAKVQQAPRLPALEALLDDGLHNFLFVGRIVPNKKIEDIIRMAEHYKRYVDTEYRFIFVGRTTAVPRYYQMIRALLLEYQMPTDRFLFTGPVSDTELAGYYRAARVYLSLSEHEGFGVPLLEAMAADVPVLAYASTAVPDTLAGAGVQFEPKDLEVGAELLGTLAYDESVRQRVITGQRAHLEAFSDAALRARVATFAAQCESNLCRRGEGTRL